MKKILLFSVVLVLAGISTIAQVKKPLTKEKSLAAKQIVTIKEPSDLDKRIAEKQLEIQRSKAAGTNTRFSKDPASKAISNKKD